MKKLKTLGWHRMYFTIACLGIIFLDNANAQMCSEPPSDMVAWWPLDESSGAVANDIVNGNTGSYIDNPTPTLGKVDGALSFDGVNDTIMVPDAQILHIADQCQRS